MEDNSKPLTLTRVWESTVSDATTQIQSANQEAGKPAQHQPLGGENESGPSNTHERLKEQRAGEKNQRQQEETSPAGGGGGQQCQGHELPTGSQTWKRVFSTPSSLRRLWGGAGQPGTPPRGDRPPGRRRGRKVRMTGWSQRALQIIY